MPVATMTLGVLEPTTPPNEEISRLLGLLFQEVQHFTGEEREAIIVDMKAFVDELTKDDSPTEEEPHSAPKSPRTVQQSQQKNRPEGVSTAKGTTKSTASDAKTTAARTTTSRKRTRSTINDDPDEQDRPNDDNNTADMAERTPVRKRKRSSDEPNLIPLSSDCDLQQIETIRNEFRRELGELKMEISLDGGKLKMTEFTTKEINDIDTLVFGTIVGRGALKRLSELTAAYSNATEKDELGDVGLAARAATLAADSNTMIAVREFFGVLSFQQRQRSKTELSLTSMYEVVQSRRLLAEYTRLCKLAQEGDPDTMTFLRKKGYTTTKGRDWRSCMIEFLAKSLDIQKDDLGQICQRAKGVNALVDGFGEGVIPLLPVRAMSKLKRLGNQRMAQVCNLLKERVASFQPICALVKEHIYDPILRGDKHVNFDLTLATENAPLVNLIEAAVKPRVEEVE